VLSVIILRFAMTTFTMLSAVYAESRCYVQYACVAILNVVMLCLVNAQFRN